MCNVVRSRQVDSNNDATKVRRIPGSRSNVTVHVPMSAKPPNPRGFAHLPVWLCSAACVNVISLEAVAN